MAIQEQYVLSKEANGDIKLKQNSVDVFSSINASAIVDTLTLKEGNVGIGTNSPGARLVIDNDETITALFIQQDGILAQNKHGIQVYTTVAHTNANSALVYLTQGNVSSTEPVLEIINYGTGAGIELTCNGDGYGIEINNDLKQHALYIHQDGVLDINQHAIYVYSNAINVNSALVHVFQNNASSSSGLLRLENDGTGYGIYVKQDGVLGASQYGLSIISGAIQVTSPLVLFSLTNALSTTPVLELDNNGKGHALYIHQDGDLASGKYALYIDNNGTPVDGAGRAIRLDGCGVSSTKDPTTDAPADWIGINKDGTQYAVPLYALS